eukprot:4206087-Pyramimonas_sp.AAC.1
MPLGSWKVRDQCHQDGVRQAVRIWRKRAPRRSARRGQCTCGTRLGLLGRSLTSGTPVGSPRASMLAALRMKYQSSVGAEWGGA